MHSFYSLLIRIFSFMNSPLKFSKISTFELYFVSFYNIQTIQYNRLLHWDYNIIIRMKCARMVWLHQCDCGFEEALLVFLMTALTDCLRSFTDSRCHESSFWIWNQLINSIISMHLNSKVIGDSVHFSLNANTIKITLVFVFPELLKRLQVTLISVLMMLNLEGQCLWKTVSKSKFS